MKTILLGAAAAIIIAAPAYAGKSGTHVTTETHNQTRTVNEHATRVHTEHQRNVVNDTTIVHDVTRVHPIIHRTEVERVLHHTQVVHSNAYATHTHVGPATVEHEPATEHVGAPGHPHVNNVYRYHDVYENRSETVVHERTGAPAIDHEITRHVTNVEVHPVVHERDITRVILDNVHRHHNEVEHSRVAGAPRVVVTHRREDVDP